MFLCFGIPMLSIYELWTFYVHFPHIRIIGMLYSALTITPRGQSPCKLFEHKIFTEEKTIESLPSIPDLIVQSAGAVEYTDPTAPPNECRGYDTKQSDGEVPAVLELWGMRSTPLLPLLPGPLWPGMVAPDRALSMG